MSKFATTSDEDLMQKAKNGLRKVFRNTSEYIEIKSELENRGFSFSELGDVIEIKKRGS